MSTQSAEQLTTIVSSKSSANDSHLFDLENYHSRVARYLDDKKEENLIFFEALRFAHDIHSGQRRKSGAPYISHPCAVAEILIRELGFKDPHLLAAALLHDVVEDIPSISLQDIENRFGETVAELVDGCTKLTRHHMDRTALKDLTHSKIFLSASRRLGVLIIKLADRLHNLRTLHFLPLSKRQRIAQETVEVYAPIAARLNLFPLKRELYHLALSFLYPRKSKKILNRIREIRNSAEVLEIEASLQKVFSNARVPAAIRPRPKGLGSYYDPMKRSLDPLNPENYMDIAVIVETENVLDCYRALGLVNTTFPPIPRSMRDFIATPKSNGYMSLHVRSHIRGHNYLIKIRTPEMDQWAAYGLMTEWDAQEALSDDHWQAVSELLRTIGEYGGAAKQRKALIRLSETEDTIVYSPNGDIFYLPKGSVVLDFAYKIHSELGDFCEGALVNNNWAPPTRRLQDGETVEILTSLDPLDVDPDLEELCKTPKARTAINRHLQQKRSHYAEDIGRQILQQEIQRHGLAPDVLESESTRLMMEILNLKDPSELCIRIGQDLLDPHLVLYYLGFASDEGKVGRNAEAAIGPAFERNIITISELDRAIHKFAQCCHPYPGQDNLVATLSERGVTFHHRDCQDLFIRHDLQPQQMVDAKWDHAKAWRYPLVFQLNIANETLMTLFQMLSRMQSRVEILVIENLSDKHDRQLIRMSVKLGDFEEARDFFTNLPSKQVSIEYYGREGGFRRVI
ncbi:(p)ppGpp synthetase [Desulforhabdus sp. TSK]|nr:(p)ppGpp synthetase [Desulforhabdus sp. TSK]